MKKKDAYQALGLNTSSNQEEVKKAFRKLAAKYHPDVNKDADAIDNFKKVNSAYQVIESGKFDDVHQNHPGQNFNHQDIGGFADFFNFNGFSNHSGGTKQIIVEDIELNSTLSFKESVLGAEKTITYKRKLKCAICNGNGRKVKPSGCAPCNGTGRMFSKQKNMMIGTICPTCRGVQNYEDCTPCKTDGVVESDSTVSIRIPPGVNNSTVLRLGGMGNYAGDFLGYSNAFLKIKVVPQTNLSLVERDVVTTIEISLLEAFRGVTREVPTIDGSKSIDIPKLIKNKEEVILPNLGVNREGKQRVIVNVNYPNNIEKIIGVLTEEQK